MKYEQITYNETNNKLLEQLKQSEHEVDNKSFIKILELATQVIKKSIGTIVIEKK